MFVNQDDNEKPQPFENTLKSRGLVSNQVNGIVPDQVDYFFTLPSTLCSLITCSCVVSHCCVLLVQSKISPGNFAAFTD